MSNRWATEDRITMKYGAGGRAMRTLIHDFIHGFPPAPNASVQLADMDDGAAIPVGDQFLIVTTDSHVVQPIVFPGGDIGRLSISGTVNDLAMMGATEPLGLTCAIVIEEGFPRERLQLIQASIQDTCREAGVTVITGDTKVMGKGEVDGLVMNTTGVGLTRRVITDKGLRPGDRIIVTGSIGDHGLAIMALRHNLAIDGDLRSDVAPINRLVAGAIAAAGDGIVAMKDPTRGGLSSSLHEMADKSGVGVVIEEGALPVNPEVRAAAELLGLDPLHIANEGKAVMGVRAAVADRVLAALQAHPLGRGARIIGYCIEEHKGQVILDTGLGKRLLAEPEGELLPRIC